jgi:hypothetical protein
VAETLHFLELLTVAFLLDHLGLLELYWLLVVVSVSVVVQVNLVGALALLLHVKIDFEGTALHFLAIHLNHRSLGGLVTRKLHIREAF